MSRPGRKRLAVDMPLHIFKRVKDYAKRRNITMTKFIARALLEAIIREEV